MELKIRFYKMAQLNVELGERSYAIEIRAGGLEEMLSGWAKSVSGRRALVISDDNVRPLYGAKVVETLSAAGLSCFEKIVPAGETSKSLKMLAECWNACFEAELDRRSYIIALGGGVVGDLAGFTAASFMRGISVVQVATTLLAQVDSSVGGKTGINYTGGKNTIGAFHQPAAVFIDVSTLKTLPAREVVAGMAEVAKYGVIRDLEFFGWMEENTEHLKNTEPEALEYAIERSCMVKAEVVAADERESGLRAILNYGHTFAHAIETATKYEKYLHGEAVAIGMRLAGELSLKLGLWKKEDLERQQTLFEALGLFSEKTGLDAAELRRLMAGDKKTVGGRLHLVLPERIGEVKLLEAPDEAALLEVLAGA